MRKVILLAVALGAVASALMSGPRPVAAASCTGCPPTIGSCFRVSCAPCCYRCGPPGTPELCE
jgi:hypothetical protein